jgi:hypothetical protein
MEHETNRNGLPVINICFFQTFKIQFQIILKFNLTKVRLWRNKTFPPQVSKQWEGLTNRQPNIVFKVNNKFKKICLQFTLKLPSKPFHRKSLLPYNSFSIGKGALFRKWWKFQKRIKQRPTDKYLKSST